MFQKAFGYKGTTTFGLVELNLVPKACEQVNGIQANPGIEVAGEFIQEQGYLRTLGCRSAARLPQVRIEIDARNGRQGPSRGHAQYSLED